MKSRLTVFALLLAGCASSSSSAPSPVPQAVPALGTPAAAETTYMGFLAHVVPGNSTSFGWQLRNANMPGSVPIDVTQVARAARTLVNQRVMVAAHSAAEPNGRLVLMADSMKAYVAAQ